MAEAVTVRKEVVVDTPIERAFTVFTGRFGDFKRGWSWSTGTSTGTARDGRQSRPAWTARRAGRCTWTATPRW